MHLEKENESEGFTLVELMIVVAIVGILAAVAMPLYARYVQKTRMSSYVFPGVHIIETNISVYYSGHGSFPAGSLLTDFCKEADTTYFHPSWGGDSLRVTLKPGPNGELQTLAGNPSRNYFIATPVTSTQVITHWALSGPLATQLGLDE